MLGPDNVAFARVPRDRVTATIARALVGRSLAVVAAPGGFGKSVAVEDFAIGRADVAPPVRAARSEASVTGFIRHLLRETGSGHGTWLPDRASDAELDAAFRGLGGPERLIVVDDFGMVAPDPRLIALIERGVRSAGPRLILVTRRLCALPFARWFAAGLVDEPVDERDLRLDVAEAARFVRAAGHAEGWKTLGPTLLRETGGWPGPFVAALASATVPDVDPFGLAAEARKAAFACVRTYVFDDLDLSERSLLLRTSLFEEIGTEALDELGPAVRAVVLGLADRTSFVGREANGAFRHHPLLRDFLRETLAREGAGALDAVAIETARILAATGRPQEALRAALHGDTQTILTALAACGRHTLERGDAGLVREALARLPETTRASDPVALALTAYAGGADDGFEARCRTVLRDPPGPSEHAELALAFAARLVRTGRPGEALRTLASVDPQQVASATLRARVLAARVAAARGRSATGGADATAEALALADASNDPGTRASVYACAAAAAVEARRFEEASRLAASAVDFSLRAGTVRIELRARATLFRATLERGRTHGALAQLLALCERAAGARDLEIQLFALSSASDAAADAGDAAWLDRLDAALEMCGDTADVFVEALGASLGDALARSRALREAWHGRFDVALERLDALGPALAPRRRARVGEAALYAAAAGAPARSLDERLRGRRLLEGGGDDDSPDAILTRLFLALAATVAGDPAESEQHLTVLESRTDRIALPYICFLRAIRVACDYAANRTTRGRLDEATAALARVGFGGFAKLIDALPIRPALVAPATGLTLAEARVLELLCDGLTSREIAGRLGRSVLTVDSHVKTIVRKLRCTGGRREAVEMARSGRIAGLPVRPSALGRSG